MPKRTYIERTDLATGIRFRFAPDKNDPSQLHVEARHGVTTEEAIATFFNTQTATWNVVNKRFETESESHVLYWAWHASGAVLVITCFRKGDH